MDGLQYSDWHSLVPNKKDKFINNLYKTGGVAPSQQNTGIAPPATIQEFLKNKINPIQNKFNQFSNASSELMNGNVMNSINMMRNPNLTSGINSETQNNAISFDSLW